MQGGEEGKEGAEGKWGGGGGGEKRRRKEINSRIDFVLQMIVQRALAAKNLAHAQGATIFAGYLKILPLFFIVIPGMISRVLFPGKID